MQLAHSTPSLNMFSILAENSKNIDGNFLSAMQLRHHFNYTKLLKRNSCLRYKIYSDDTIQIKGSPIAELRRSNQHLEE